MNITKRFKLNPEAVDAYSAKVEANFALLNAGSITYQEFERLHLEAQQALDDATPTVYEFVKE